MTQPRRPQPGLHDFPSLRTFGERLAAPDVARRTRPGGALRGRGLPRGLTFGSAGVAALVVCGSAAAGLTALTGSPIPAPLRADDTVTVWPRDGESRVAAARAPDPDGGPAWGVRVGGADGGLVCAAPGQVRGAAFGIVGRDGRFRELPEQLGGGCVSAPEPGRPIVAARAVAGDAVGPIGLPTRGTTVVYGLGGPELRGVVVRPAVGPVHRLRPTTDGAFVVALRGLPPAVQPVVDLEWRDGTRRRVDLRQLQTAPDPQGGAGWALSTTDAVQVARRPGAPAPPEPRRGAACFTVLAAGQGAPWVCGGRGRGAWAIRPAARPRRPETQRAPRWSGASRTLVLVRSGPGRPPVVRGGGRAWPVRWAGVLGPGRRLERSDQGWVAVLPASVDPRDVRVRDADGAGREREVGRATLEIPPPYRVTQTRRP